MQKHFLRKRDGSIVDFDTEKIRAAIQKACKAVNGYSNELIERLTKRVVERLPSVQEVYDIEFVQDIVEQVLIENKMYRVAKAYILYRKQHQNLRQMGFILNSNQVVDDYIQALDWRVKENSNMSYSMQGLNNHISSIITNSYWLNRLYPEEIRRHHEEGDFHIHDLGTLGAYCCGWDLPDLLMRGFGGVSAKLECKPAKHFRTALGQIVNFFYTLQGESAGAQALANFDTYLAPFVAHDNLSYPEIKQAMQEFVFNMNVPTRVGFQTPFTNVTMDLECPKKLRETPAIIGGKPHQKNLGDFQKEMDLVNKAFIEVMLEGDASGRVFTFPIPTYNITKDFEWDNPNFESLWEMTAKYGIPYFANFVNSEMNPDDARSMCCRLRLDNRELQKRGGGLFGANPLTGCYAADTEILTVDGWKFFKDLKKEDSVLTLRKDNRIEVYKPKKLFEYNWNGEMIQFKTRSLDLLVTPNHRMVVDIAQSGKRKFVEAKDFDVNNHRIPKQSVWKGVEQYFFILPSIEFTKYGRQGRTPYSVVRGALQIKMDSWLAFFGFWLAEGSTDNEKIAKRHGYRVFISQVNPKKRMEIKEILRLLPFAFAEEGANLVICNKQLWTYLRQFGNKYQKFIPKEILALSSRQLKILFDWMVKGDGHIRRTTGQINYWTASKKLADTAQEVILKLGYLGTVIFRKGRRVVIRGRTVKGKGIYVLGVQTSNHYRLRKKNIHYSNYAGKVYCCEVQNNTVLVRRNGKVCWCGNSIGVVTLNLPKLGFMAKSKEEFFANLDLLMGAAKESLLIKRKILEKYTALGLYPYSKNYLRAIFDQTQHYWGNHFSTIGLIGMNECLLNLIGKDITDAEGQKLAGEILDNMREKITQFQVETGGLFNLEATPAEGTSYRLARLDKKRIPAIIVANEHAWQKDNSIAPYYTNSSHLPVNFTDDVFDALDRQDPLQVKYTGGTVLHTFIGEKKPSSEGVKQLVKTITQHYRLPYFTLTPTFSVCSNDGYLAGEHHLCPKCQEACEVYSRIVGYYRPIQNWNAGKQEEFKDRTLFELAKIRKGE